MVRVQLPKIFVFRLGSSPVCSYTQVYGLWYESKTAYAVKCSFSYRRRGRALSSSDQRRRHLFARPHAKITRRINLKSGQL